MAAFCGGGGDFWNLDAVWNTETPLLSNCFRQSVLVLLPCGLLWLTCALRLLLRCGAPGHAPGPSPITAISILKWVLSCVLMLCSVLGLARTAYLDHSAVVDYVSGVARLTTFGLALALQVLQRRDGRPNSYMLSLFWVFFFVCDLPSSPFFQLALGTLSGRTDRLLFAAGCVQSCVLFLQTLLSLFTDGPTQDEYVIEHQPLLARIFFTWISRVLLIGYRRTIGLKDLDQLSPTQKTRHLHHRFQECWQIQEKKEARTLGREGALLFATVARAIWPWLLTAALLDLLYDFAEIVPALLLDRIIQFMGNDEPGWHGYVYALLLFALSSAATLLLSHDLHYLVCASIVPRSGLQAAIYRKTLRLSCGARRRYALGELCNLVAVDAGKITDLIWNVNLVWSAPLRILLNVALLWRYLGVACLSGVAAILLIMPLTGLLAKRTHRLQETQMKLKDSRLKQMSEILNGIKVLKLYAWELPFLRRVGETRGREAALLRQLAFLNGANVFLWACAPFLVAVSSFVTYVLMDPKNVLDPRTAFVSLTLLNNLRSSMSFVPQSVAQLVQSRIAFRRIATFLLSEELQEDAVEHQTAKDVDLEVESGTFAWSRDEVPFLRDVSLRVAPGHLVAVVGSVGSGKSALLSALLGEMHRVRGRVGRRKGSRMAYVPQEAWVQNASLRQNVLFLRDMDEARYDDVLTRCCLQPDLRTLPAADLTEIGEKGVNLSGGQKQRVSLARAVYQDADVYLLDDPLSAVDAHVGAQLFEGLLGPRGLLSDKTRVLVTHDPSVMAEADAVVFMADGRIQEVGDYRQLREHGGRFASFLQDVSGTSTRPADEEEEEQQEAGRLIEEEKLAIGSVKAGVFVSYFRKATFGLIILIALGFVFYECFEVGSNVWLSEWSSDSPAEAQDIGKRNLRLGVYGALGLGQGASVLAAGLLLAVASTRASVRSHKDMLWSVLRSPMHFFETTPIGRILNRFGSDINTVDVSLPGTLNQMATVVVGAVGAAVVIAISNPYFILLALLLAPMFLVFQSFYIATSRQTRRLEAATRSPLLSHFAEAARGGAVVRAFDAREALAARHDRLTDDNTRVFFASSVVNRFGAVAFQMIGSATVLAVGLFGASQRGIVDAATLGLMLSYALNMTNILVAVVRQVTVIETQMVSVERIEEYTNLPSEASWETPTPPPDWPNAGAISFQNYSMRYRSDMDLALKGITVDVAAGEKVGVVGRTGAGKTSLVSALFRIIEPADGRLLIDGVDVTEMGLHELRSKLTIIPQDPVVFSGSLRLNLDPLNEYGDQSLWTALEDAHLKDFVKSLECGLAYEITEVGDNLSVGQRQQLCLARALLKCTRVLVLDEATAAVDMETDRFIQATLRSKLAGCTILAVAHRLRTVLDYDRILVMEDGRIIEEGHPDALLKDPDSEFNKLAKAAGLVT